MNRDNRCKHLCIFLLILISIFLASTLKKTDAIAGESGSVSPYYGSFSTQIPITIPVFHGLEPNLKLVYSSSGSNSWVGIGWSLSGFSVIERSSSGGGTPRYNDDDIFFLDGMELVASTMQGGTHCTKIQNYTRILQDTVNNKWYVWGTNGNKATYEPSYQTSKGIFRWMLSELEDPHGNVVNYDYWCEGTSAATCCYLDTISYNRTVITFYRELRPDPITFATGANLGQINYRLKTIDVQVNGQRARVYKLNYKQSVNTSRSLLSNIQQFGNDAIVDDTSWNVTGETFLPAMTFGWQEGSDGIFDNYTSTGGPGKNIFFADVNGDGRTDLIKHDPASGKVYTFISNDDGSFDNNYSTTEGPGGNKDGYVSFGDVNGDGRTDLVKHDSVGTVYTYLSDGDGTFGSHSTTTGPGGKGAGYVVITDVNGDSRADLIKLDSDAVLYTCLSNGDGTFGDYRITGGQGKNIYFANLNGDAQADLVRRDASTIYAYLSNDDGAFGNYTATDGVDGEIYFADVNGDGRSDLIRHDSGRIYTHLSNGDGTFGGFTITDGIDEKISFADINGDRRADLIKNDSGTIYTYLSNGDGTFESYSISNDGPGEDIYFADVSGDGVNDLIKKDDSNTVYTFLSKEMPDIITSIFNGVGGTSSIEYKPSSYWSNTNLPMVMQTVYKTTTGDGRGNQSATEYRYEGGLWSASERRFLGFRKVSAVLDAQGNYTETYYYQKVGSISKPEVTYFKDNQGQIFRYTLYAYTENTSPPYTSLLTDRWEYECNLSENCMKTLNQFAYDEYGNVIATYEWGDYERDGDERTTVRGYYPNKDLYIAGLPAYENMYEGIVSVSENREIVPISGTGELIQRKLYNYDQNTSFEAPPTKGDATEVLKWNSETGDYVSVKTEYDRWGNAILHFDERDFESTTKFDPVYHIYKEEQCNSLGHCTLMKWDAAMGLLTSNTDVANGTTTWYSYDPLGRPLAKEHPDESLIEYDYLDWGDPNNQRIRKTMPDGTDDGLWTEVYQDGLGRKYKTVKEGGFIKETLFSDATNRVWKESLWYQSEDGPHWIVYSYDGTGRLRTSANPDGTFSEVVYANARNGKPYTASYDELRNEKVVWKDAYGNIAQIREKNGEEYYYTTYEYDMMGNPVRIVDSGGGISTSVWDSFGRKLSSCNEDMGCWSYTYYDDGLLWTQTDAKKQTITFTYDDLGRISTKSLPDGEKTQYFYDEPEHGYSKGRLTQVLYPSGSESYTWNIRGLKTSITRCADGICKETGQEYDAMGRVKRITYPDKEEVYYHYDSDGRLNEVSGYAYGMAWNANGQLKSVSFSNNTSTSFEYDNDRLWLDSATATGPAGVLYDAEYDYDDAARVLSVASGTNSLLNLGFGYDDLNRLTDVSGSQNQSFAYDSRGNITSVQYGYSVPAEATNASYSYDVNGNMEEDGFRVYTWDYENRLTSIKKDNLTTTFLYDSDGTRIKKSGPRGTVRYFGGLAELVDGSLVKYYYAGPILIARQDATGKYWYHSDHLGSVRLITDEQGQKVNTYDYAAFGHTISESGSLNNEHNFTGHRRDPETGLIYMGSRYYNTLLGRFISADTIVPDPTNPQALNRYAYAYNNPISNVDPTGHAPVAVAVISAATVIGAWSAGTVSGIVAATAVIGAGVTIAGYFAKDPVLSTIGSVMLGFAGGYMMPGALVGQVASGLIGASVSGLTSPLSPLDPDVKEVIGWAYTAYGLIMAANEGATKQLPGDNSDFGNLIKEAAPSFAKGEKPPNWEQIVAFCEMSQADEIEFINNIINKKIYKGWETVNPEFWGSGVQQLFGQRIAERAGVNKWLAILKNPSGGLVGPGFGKWWFPAWYDKGFMGVHGAIHDADAILLKDYNIGWGYANWPHPGLFPSVPQSGQIGGLSVQLISNSFQYYFGL